MSGMQIRIIDVLYVVIKRWKMILALAVVGLCVGFATSGISYMQSGNMNYYIWCNVAVTAQTANGNFPENRTAPANTDNSMAVDMTDAVIFVITSYGVLESSLESAGLEDSMNANTISSYLSVSRYEETQIIGMTLQWSDTDAGLRFMEALVQTSNQKIQDTFKVGALSVIDGPDVYYISSEGGRTFMKNAGIMGALGALAGIGIVLLELILRPTLLDLKDVEKVLKLETVGVIPRDDAYFRRKTDLLVRSDDETSAVEQNYSSTAYILRNIMGTKNKRNCFYVTSAADGEGKSMVAANLAIQLSDMGKRVLLVDLDVRKPSLGGLFLNAVDYSRSLNALYKGEATVRDAVNPLTGTLDFLPLVLERTGIPLDDTLFEMIEQISENYQYMIIDAPSIGKSADALSLNRLAQMVLFVVRYDSSTIQAIQAAIKTLDKSGIRILGCVVNAYQAIEWNSFFGNSRKKPQTRKKKKRKKTSDKEHTAEINAMVVREDEDEDMVGFPAEMAGYGDGDIMAEVAGGSRGEEEQMSTEDALEALLKMGADGSWKEERDAARTGAGSVWDGLDGPDIDADEEDGDDGEEPDTP